MNSQFTRRRFLGRSLAGGGLLGLGNLAFLDGLESVSAAEVRLDPAVVRCDPSIEPLVRFLEETPRERLLEEMAARIHGGLGYRDVVAALLLAGVRNVQPRPYVGFKFHTVLVVNSAHLASISSPASLRWLPIFWALDYFKSAQARDVKEGDWTMAPVDEKAVPPAHMSRAAFVRAMESWDVSAADTAVAGFGRSAGVQDVFELFFRYGARDFRSIGHKAIFVANSWRVLGCIGWRHAEPVLRSLAYALLNHHGDDNPAKIDAAADRPWRRNQDLARKIPASWQSGTPDGKATSDLVGGLRQGSDEAASDQVVDLLARGVAPRSIWDAFFEAASELVMRKPGIMSLHAATTTNALHFAYRTCGNDETRRLIMLQNAAFLPLFREAAIRRSGKLAATTLESLEPMATEKSGVSAIDEIFADLGDRKMVAANKALTYLKRPHAATDLINAARVLVFLKGSDAHDYKYSSAVLEDFYNISPGSRNRFMASSLFLLRSSTESDNGLVQRIRDALSNKKVF